MGVSQSHHHEHFLAHASDIEEGFSVDEVQTIFSEFDTSGDGRLDKEEGLAFLKAYCEAKKIAYDEDTLESAFVQLDKQKNGKLDWAELLSGQGKIIKLRHISRTQAGLLSHFHGNTCALTRVEQVDLAVAIFQESRAPTALKMNLHKLKKFSAAVIDTHEPHAYHNCGHAVHVMLSTYRFIGAVIDFYPPLEVFALLVAALCHDIQHAGKSNQMLEAQKHPFAVKYAHEKSYLENNSLEVALQLSASEGCEIFESLDEQQTFQAKEMIRELILLTDLGNQPAAQLAEEQFLECCSDSAHGNWRKSQVHRLALAKTLLLCADIGCVCEQTPIYCSWVKRLLQETRAATKPAGEAVADKDLPTTVDFVGGQQKFLDTHAIPMFEKVAQSGLVPGFTIYCDSLRANRSVMSDSASAAGTIDRITLGDGGDVCIRHVSG